MPSQAKSCASPGRICRNTPRVEAGESAVRALIQRVKRGRVTVGERTLAEIGPGLVVLLGVRHGDTQAQADYLADKTAHLRIFEDLQGKTNLSVLDVGGEVLVVSQFTLYADTRKGRRPSFVEAAPPEVAEPLVARFAAALAAHGVPTQVGKFGAHMVVDIVNDGPMTVLLER